MNLSNRVDFYPLSLHYSHCHCQPLCHRLRRDEQGQPRDGQIDSRGDEGLDLKRIRVHPVAVLVAPKFKSVLIEFPAIKIISAHYENLY